MHYIVNVFVAPGNRLKDAMAPFEEGIALDSEEGAWHGVRTWDWWVIGGRWDGYFGEGRNMALAGEIASGGVKGEHEAPFAFLTLSGVSGYPDVSRNWHSREIYVPGGYLEEVNGKWQLSYFLDTPNHAKHYHDYVRSVPPETEVHAVDVHQ